LSAKKVKEITGVEQVTSGWICNPMLYR